MDSAMSSLQEVIVEADLRCAKCQEGIANAVSRVEDVESMEVNVLKKKVILTRKSKTHEPVSEEISSRKAANVDVDVDNKQSPKVLELLLHGFLRMLDSSTMWLGGQSTASPERHVFQFIS